MKNFEFKSQICTSRSQSEKLLALGLKKETADMHLTNMSTKGIAYTDNLQIGSIPYKDVMDFYEERGFQLGKTSWEIIPAWSLHRLMEIMYNGDIFGFVSFTTHDRNIDTIYELVIANIEGLIKIDHFNQDYLEEKK